MTYSFLIQFLWQKDLLVIISSLMVEVEYLVIRESYYHVRLLRILMISLR